MQAYTHEIIIILNYPAHVALYPLVEKIVWEQHTKHYAYATIPKCIVLWSIS